MKVKIEKQTTVTEEVEITFPFYAHLNEQGDYHDTDYYVKITEDMFYLIKFEMLGVEISKHKSKPTTISEHWYKNQCTQKIWLEGLNYLKQSVNEFE